MLKINTRQARENIKNYIIDNLDVTGYEKYSYYYQDGTIERDKFSMAREIIKDVFYNEMLKYNKMVLRYSHYELFKEWCQGLPSALDTCYYYNRSAIKDLGDILEETEEERNRFTESQAGEKLTYLIYREIFN